MTFPNFAGKHDEDPLITPEQAVEYLRGHRGADEEIPPAVVLVYSPRVLDAVTERHGADQVRTPAGPVHVLRDAPVAIKGDFGIGAPAAGMVMEELIASGVVRFASIGAAGFLQPGAQSGDICLCTSAVRDEGFSHHYLPVGQLVAPTEHLTNRLRESLPQPFAEGPSWTIDAPFRETIAEVRHYQRDGVMTVEMEASALFAVAQVRGVEICSAFVASDTLGELVWQPKFGEPIVRERLLAVVDAAIEAIS